MYGRGACDMKSGLACALTAFSSVLRRIGETGRWPGRSITLIGSVDEEDFMRGVEKAIKRDGSVPRTGFLIRSPRTGRFRWPQGQTWFELTIEGATAHASTPWKGATQWLLCRRRCVISEGAFPAARSTMNWGALPLLSGRSREDTAPMCAGFLQGVD